MHHEHHSAEKTTVQHQIPNKLMKIMLKHLFQSRHIVKSLLQLSSYDQFNWVAVIWHCDRVVTAVMYQALAVLYPGRIIKLIAKANVNIPYDVEIITSHLSHNEGKLGWISFKTCSRALCREGICASNYQLDTNRPYTFKELEHSSQYWQTHIHIKFLFCTQ